MEKWMYLIVGGAAGTVARYLMVVSFASPKFGNALGTLIVNLLGCFLIGVFDVLAQKKLAISPQIRLALMAGFCGAFTTFSAFILDANNLMKEGETFRAIVYVVLSVVLCFVTFRLGVLFGDLF